MKKYLITLLVILTPFIALGASPVLNNWLIWNGTNWANTSTSSLNILTYGTSTALTNATSTTFAITRLATPAGAFLAVNALGSVIATTTPTGGTVTSVDMSVPTGLTISGNPITGAGTLALTLTSGYVIPLTASTTQWNNLYNASTSYLTLANWFATTTAPQLGTLAGLYTVGSSTGATSYLGSSTFTKATTTSLGITGLATPAGAFMAVDSNGSVIATTTPAPALTGGTTNYMAYWTSASTLSATSSPTVSSITATTTTATSTFAGGITAQTNKFVVQSSSGRVGIATATPATELDVYGTTTTRFLSVDDGGTGTTTLAIGGVGRPACLKARDTDDGGWSYGTLLNGAITWSTTSCE